MPFQVMMGLFLLFNGGICGLILSSYVYISKMQLLFCLCTTGLGSSNYSVTGWPIVSLHYLQLIFLFAVVVTAAFIVVFQLSYLSPNAGIVC